MFLLKILLSAVILVTAVEVAKRSAWLGSIIIALPLTSMLALVLLYWETRDAAKAGEFARDIFYLVPPSLLFFVPFLAEPYTRWPFWLNFGAGLAAVGVAVTLGGFLLK